VNANLTKGIEDSEALRAIERCKEILKKPKKGEGFVEGWTSPAKATADLIKGMKVVP